jgi:hypothetical protein
MIHGDHKAKEMARSILPSRARGVAAWRARIHRAERRQVSQSLRTLACDPAEWEDGVELGEEAALELPYLVSRRRGGDKLNHFERWAIERTREVPKEQRLGYLRGLLPRGIIGEHAMVHLKQREELVVHPYRPVYRIARKLLLARGELAVILREVLEVGDGVRSLHQAMNRAVRVDFAGNSVRCAGRRLLGVHDVLPFLDWLEKNRNSHFVVDAFCRAFKETRNVEVALTRTVMKATIPFSDVERIRR